MIDKKAFALYAPWNYRLPHAEKEVIERIRLTAKNLDINCYVANNKGYIYNLEKNRAILTKTTIEDLKDELDFVIHTHLDTTKMHDVFTFNTLWIPSWSIGEGDTSRIHMNLKNTDDYLLNSGQNVLDYAIETNKDCTNSQYFNFLEFFPSISETTFLDPKVLDKYNLFYIGVAWEVLANKKARHGELLSLLDKTPYAKFYGPKKINGLNPWRDFESYQNQNIPFDGISILKVINDTGIVLALSSLDHQRADVVTNRIHEGIAAGAVIISTRHTMLEELFKDNIFFVDNNNNAHETFCQINEIVQYINNNTEEVRQKVLNTQKIYKKHLSTEVLINNLYANIEKRKEIYNESFLSQNENDKVGILAIYDYPTMELSRKFITNLLNQNYSNTSINILVDNSLMNAFKKQLTLMCNEQQLKKITIFSTSIFQNNKDTIKTFGILLLELQEQSNVNDCKYLMVLNCNASIFKDNILLFKKKFENDDSIEILVSNFALTNTRHKNYVELHLNNPYDFYKGYLSPNNIYSHKKDLSFCFMLNDYFKERANAIIIDFDYTGLFYWFIAEALSKDTLYFLEKIRGRIEVSSNQEKYKYETGILDKQQQLRLIYNLYQSKLLEFKGLYKPDHAFIKKDNLNAFIKKDNLNAFIKKDNLNAFIKKEIKAKVMFLFLHPVKFLKLTLSIFKNK